MCVCVSVRGVARIRDVGCAHLGFALCLARIRCPNVRCAHPWKQGFWLWASVSNFTLARICIQDLPCMHPYWDSPKTVIWSPFGSRVLLCFIKAILGNRYVRSRGFIVSEPRETHPRSEIADVPTLPCLPLDICIYIYIYTYIDICTHLYRHTFVHVSMKQNYIETDTTVEDMAYAQNRSQSVPTYIVKYLFTTYARTYTHTHTHTHTILSLLLLD